MDEKRDTTGERDIGEVADANFHMMAENDPA